MDFSAIVPKQATGLEAPLVDRHLAKGRSLMKVGSIFAAVLIAPALVWLTVAPLDSAVLASGAVKVDNNRALVQHVEGGIVRSVLVRDGQLVKAGDPLIELGDVAVQADQRRLMQRLLSERAGQARLEAEQSRRSVLVFDAALQEAAQKDPVIAEQLEKEKELFRSRLTSLNSSTALFRQRQDHSRNAMAALRASIDSSRNSISLQKGELELNQRMAKDGLVSNLQVMQLEARVSDYTGRIAQQSADLTRAEQRIGEINLRINQLENDYRQQGSDQLRVALLRIQEIEQELRKADDASRRQVLTAPLAGEVINLKVHSPGTVLMPRQLAAEIVPKNPKLVVEAQIDPKDIMRVVKGQHADLRMLAFTYRTTKMVAGTVSYVGGDRLLRESDGAPYYIVHVEVDPKSVEEAVLGQADAKMQAGMPVEVFILGDSRTALQYLLDPVTQIMRRAGRES